MSECVTLTAVAEQAGQRLDRWLADTLGRDDLSRSRLKALIQGGALCRDGQVITDPSAKVSADTAYSLTLPDAVPAIPQAEPLPLDILFEDEHLICINKAAGMVVHPAPGALSGTLVNALLAHCGDSLTGIGGVARPGIVHRLDKDTSGVMVAAKTAAAHAKLTDMFAAHDLDRRYQALIWGLPANRSDTIDAALARHPTDRPDPGPCGCHPLHNFAGLAAFWLPCGMPAGDRPHTPDPCAYGPYRAWRYRRSYIWPAQAGRADSGHHQPGRSSHLARFSAPGPACGPPVFCAPHNRRSP